MLFSLQNSGVLIPYFDKVLGRPNEFGMEVQEQQQLAVILDIVQQ